MEEYDQDEWKKILKSYAKLEAAVKDENDRLDSGDTEEAEDDEEEEKDEEEDEEEEEEEEKEDKEEGHEEEVIRKTVIYQAIIKAFTKFQIVIYC